MITRRLSNIVLLIGLGILLLAYAGIVASFRAQPDVPDPTQHGRTDGRSLLLGLYAPGYLRALDVNSRLKLEQVAPTVNAYIAGDESASPVAYGTLGATACRVRALLDARHEEVEGVSTTVYDLDFEGTYTLRHETSAPPTTLELIFAFPAGLDTLNGVTFLVDGEEPDGVQYSLSSITWRTEIEAGEEHEITIRYRARGVGSFRYAIDHNRRLEELDVEIVVRGLTGSEVPEHALPSTAVMPIEGGEKFAWQYDALIADRDVHITLPARSGFVQRVERLQEPLRRLSLASPLLVVLFVACLAGVHRLSDVHLPSQHYLLAGLGFFLFYPALTFLSGAVELGAAAVVASLAVTALLIAFVGRAAGWRRTVWQTLLLCSIFLGLFSLGTMSDAQGLLITVGALLLVGTFMMLVARRRVTEPVEPEPMPDDFPAIEVEPMEPQPDNGEAVAETAPSRHCPHCGGALDEDFAFCPTCGHDANVFRRCPACGSQHYVPPEIKLGHCPACGNTLGDPQD